MRYKDLLTQFPDAHTAAGPAGANIKTSGSTPRPPFIASEGNYQYGNNIWFESAITAVDKLNFVKSVGAQGVVIWEISNDVWEDGKSIIKALYRASGQPEQRPALPERPGVPSDALTPFIERCRGYADRLAVNVGAGREAEAVQLSELAEPSDVQAITEYMANTGRPTGEEPVLEQWKTVEEDLRR